METTRDPASTAWLARRFLAFADPVAVGAPESSDAEAAEALALAQAIMELVPSAEVGVALSTPRHTLETVAVTSDRMGVLQRFELDIEEGPSVDAARRGTPVTNIGLGAKEAPWARYQPMAAAMGYQMVHGFALAVGRHQVGALCLASVQPHPLRRGQIETLGALGAAAASGVLQRRELARAQTLATQLEGALVSRVPIEQAKGMVAARLDLTAPQAFEVLRRYARSRGLVLRALCREVIEGRRDPATLAHQPGTEGPGMPPGVAALG